MSPSPCLEVAVVGCGIGGPAAALLLARAGHSVTVFEQAEELGPKGAGILIAPTGQFVLERLGLLDQVIAHGSRIHRLSGTTASGRQIMDIRYRCLGAGLFGLGIHRGTLFSILSRAMQDQDIQVRTGHAVMAVTPDRMIETNEGTHGPFDLVVLCDGARSTLRSSVCQVTRHRPYGFGALWASVTNWGEIPDNVLRQVYRGTRRMMGLLPSGRIEGGDGRQISMFWSIPIAGTEEWRARGLESWKREVIELDPSVKELLAQIESVDQLTIASYLDVRTRASARNQTVIIGDAAHASSPQLGQGASLALFDAMILSDCLAAEANVTAALLQFQELRKRHVYFYQQASKWMTPFFQSNQFYLAWPRDLLLGAMCKQSRIQKEMVATMCGLKQGAFSMISHDQQIRQMGARLAFGNMVRSQSSSTELARPR